MKRQVPTFKWERASTAGFMGTQELTETVLPSIPCKKRPVMGGKSGKEQKSKHYPKNEKNTYLRK